MSIAIQGVVVFIEDREYSASFCNCVYILLPASKGLQATKWGIIGYHGLLQQPSKPKFPLNALFERNILWEKI